MERLGQGSGAEGVQALLEVAHQVVEAHVPKVIRQDRCTHKEP